MIISIIIPTYHPGNYIIECIESLVNQSLSSDVYEIIIVLNGEYNPYYEFIQCNLPIHSNIKLIYTQLEGVSNARNIGIDHARGDYIAFIDDDDTVSSTYLESLINCINSSPEGTIVCSDVRTFDSENNIGTDYISNAYAKALVYPNKNGLINRRSFLSSSCCKLIPRIIIGKRRFNPKISLGEDSLFMATISDKITNIIPATNDAIYYRRIRPGSATRSKQPLIHTLKRKCQLVGHYLKIYLTGFPRYNFPFILTRLLAVIKN